MLRPATALFGLLFLAGACGPRADDGPLNRITASCIPPQTEALAGLDIDRLQATPLGPKLGLFAAAHPAYVVAAYGARDFLLLYRGDYREPPSGATLVDPHLAISGGNTLLQSALAQHKTGVPGAADLVSRAAALAKAAPVWAVVRGGRPLPLTGNAANLNRLLQMVDVLTLTAKPGDRIDVAIAGYCRDAATAQRLEETLRAALSLAGAANPRLAPTIESSVLRRDGAVVHATASLDSDTASSLFDSLVR